MIFFNHYRQTKYQALQEAILYRLRSAAGAPYQRWHLRMVLWCTFSFCTIVGSFLPFSIFIDTYPFYHLHADYL